MSDNLTVFDTNYTNVIGIKAKGTGNGTLTYIRPAGTLSITENGTKDVTNYASVDVDVSGGGGSSDGNMSDPIRFFDYDGTLVASYSAVPESLPSVPTHDKLTNGTWNYTLSQVETQFNAMGTCDVGANYDTVSGATEIDIVLQDGRLHPYLSLAVNGTVTIDWGDNSTDTATGTTLTALKNDIHHEYSAAGSYTIKITKTSGTGYSLYCGETYTLLTSKTGSGNVDRVYADKVKSVRIGLNCTVNSSSFVYCHSLESVSIPSTITSIGSFRYCYSIKHVTIPSGVTQINQYAFQYCYALKSVTIPSTVTRIDSNAFNNCYALESVSVPSEVTLVNSNTFQYCYSLKHVTIPSTITSIGSSVFNSCQSLKSVTIPNTVTSIGASAFNGCYALESVLIPSGVTSIGANAFQNCQSFKSGFIPSGVTSIGSGAFRYCQSLETVSIPDTVTSIGSGAFESCYMLKSASIPSGVTSISGTTFQYCQSLEHVTIPNTVTSIGASAFNGCYALESVLIPSGVASIGANTFQNCKSLESVTIPIGVTSIGANAFNSCDGMVEYHFEPTIPPTLTNTNAFLNISSDCVIYVPAASLTAYQEAENWSTYASRMVGE